MNVFDNHPEAKLAVRKQLLQKALEKNQELGMRYYSEDPETYRFMGCNVFDDHAVFIFQCPRSSSNLAVRVNKKERSAGPSPS